MTIITKAILEKKPDKLGLPLVSDDSVTVNINDGTNEEDRAERAEGVCGFSYCTTMYLFFTALIVMTFGFIGGLYLYDQYGRAHSHHFQGWYNIPYGRNNLDMPQEAQLKASYLEQDFFNKMTSDDFAKYLKEFVEASLDEENYEKIDVPDFLDGRQGRFVHDFNLNMTGIMDMQGHRCFIMPLDRETVLPPRSFVDLLNKMWGGYYKVDMTLVKQNMRAVLPQIQDFSQVGPYITRECKDFPTYRLEKFVRSVVKRSADPSSSVRFTQFAGKNVQELSIVNFDDVLKYEEELQKSS